MRGTAVAVSIAVSLTVFSFSGLSQAMAFGPSSCEDLYSTDLVEEATHEIDYRIEGLVAATNTKVLFTTRGTDTNPWVRNPEVWTSTGTMPLDLSGASPWNSEVGYTKGGTLVTPRHLVFADHYPIATSSTVVFVAPDNTIVTRTLVAQRFVDDDIRIGVLDSDVPASIAFYPVITNEELERYFLTENPAFILLDREEKALIRERQGPSIDHYWIHNAPVATSSRYAFHETLVVGDSGKPGFLVLNNQPILVVTTVNDGYGDFYGYFLDELNAAIVALGNDGGYELSRYDLSCFLGVNEAPVFSSGHYTFFLSEGATTGAVVGTATATDPDTLDTLTYSITTSTASSTFTIDSATGDITLSDQDLLDYDATSTYALSVAVVDDRSEPLSDTATVSIIVTRTERPEISFQYESSEVSELVGSTTVTVVLSEPYTKDISASVDVSEVSAHSGTDYVLNSGSVTVPAGETEASISITVVHNTESRSNRIFSLELSGPVKATLGDIDTHMVTIRNIDQGSGGGGGGGGGGGDSQRVSLPASTAGTPTRDSIISALSALIRQFIALGGETTPAMRAFVSPTRFARDLEVGSVGEDVRALQQFLNGQGFVVAVTGPGSPGNETTYFGEGTKEALRRFQESEGIMPVSGYFGPVTRSLIESKL